MNAHHLLVLAALLQPAAFAAREEPASDKKPALAEDDKKYLDGLMKEFLFDPKGAERVSMKTVVRTVWAKAGEETSDGWLVPGKESKPARVYFTDGASVASPADKDMKKVDFIAACKARYAALGKKEETKDDTERDEVFRKMRKTAVGAVEEDDLALAAWLFRLGNEGLAAQALAAARGGKGDPRQRLRGELAWSAFAGMVHAYMVRADDEALAHGERLLRLYADEAKGKDYNQAALVVEELKRRQMKGTFGKEPAEKWPDGFDKWDAKKKTAYLIDALDEVDARQWGQPGGVDMASDRRVEELIRVGDAAVPDLIDALEKDERLTRSVHFWRDFARARTVLSVREAALTAVMSILRVRVFEPAATGDNFTSRGEEGAKETVKRLRSYWKEYGDLPFDERMMKVLTDPKTNFNAKREAAGNLATLTKNARLRTTIYPTIVGEEPPPKPNPAVAKFDKPTTAEAILAAMDADLKAFDAGPRERDADYQDYERRGVEGTYLSALVELGDKRIAPELAKRAGSAESVRGRRQWAQAAHYLGDPKPFRSFAEDFAAGKIKLATEADESDTAPGRVKPDGDRSADRELASVIGALAHIGTPEAERALDALVDQKHPQHKAVARHVLTGRSGGFDDGPWLAHPFCLRFLRGGLDDTTPTGATFRIEKDRLVHKEKNGSGSEGVPEFLADAAVRRDEAAERACDRTAAKLSEMVVGLPRTHPLLKDDDQRLAAMKASLDRYAGGYRRLRWLEGEGLGIRPWSPTYIPDIRPLGRPATAEDVKAGKAVFHLDGKGKPTDLKLPAVAVKKGDEKKKETPRVLIVQAEQGPNGDVTYGIITREDIRAVPASELTNIKTFAELEEEEKNARDKSKEKKD